MLTVTEIEVMVQTLLTLEDGLGCLTEEELNLLDKLQTYLKVNK